MDPDQAGGSAFSRNEATFEAILGAITEAVTIRDRDDTIIYANPAALKQLGFESVEALSEADPRAIMAEFVVTGADGGPLGMEDVPSVRIFRGEQPDPLLMKTVNRRTGAERWQLLKAAPLFDANGSIEATVTVIEDVTSAKQAELQAISIAETLQRSFMPEALPEMPGWELASFYQPAGGGLEVGGDFYDVFAVDGSWIVLIGDVTGKGVHAAVMTALVRHSARIIAEDHPEPARILRRLNQVLSRQDSLSICTAICLLVEDDRVTLSVAGHPLPLLVAAGDAQPVGEPGTLLGAGDDGRWTEQTLAVAPGETLLLFTDGITDTVGEGERFGDERLRETAVGLADAPGDALLAQLEAALTAFQVGPQADDTAALALRRAQGA